MTPPDRFPVPTPPDPFTRFVLSVLLYGCLVSGLGMLLAWAVLP